MTTSRTRVATVLALLVPLAATGLAVPGTASADTPTARLWYVSGEDNDALSYGLYYRDGSGQPVTVEDPEAVDVVALSASSDGSRVIYLRADYDRELEEIVVRDTSTQLVRVLETVDLGSDTYLGEPFLSPDGTTAVWESYDDLTEQRTTRMASVASGGATDFATGLSPYAFLSNDTVLLQDAAGDPFTQLVSDASATLTPVAGLSPMAVDVTVSPDGATVAFGLIETVPVGAPAHAPLVVAALNRAGDTWSVGTSVPLEEGGFNEQPAFSPDGSTVTWNHNDGALGQGDLWTAPANGSAPATALGNTVRDDVDVAFTDLPTGDTTAPGAVTPLAFTLAGTRATIRWTLPTDAEGDLSGVRIDRRLLDGAGSPTGAATVRFVPSGTSAYVDSGLVQGQSYQYDFRAVDRSGNLSTVDSRKMSATGAGAIVQDPTSRTTTRAPFPVRFATTNAASVRYTVTYSTNNSASYLTWVTDATGIQRTFTASVPGSTYRFRVVAKDAFDNSTATAQPTTTAVVPLDQTRATLSGGTNVARSDSWFGSLRALSRTTHYARITVTGIRFQLIVERCPTCGVVDVYDGGTRVASVDTRAGSRQPRAVVYTRTWSGSSSHTITLRPRATAGRPNVLLDGFAVRR